MRSMLATVMLLLSLAACGGSDNPDKPDTSAPKATSEPAATPSVCAEIWLAGETLPASYKDCEGGNAINGKCLDGSTYFGRAINGKELFAVVGGTIVDEDSDDGPGETAYTEFTKQCLGY